MADKIRERALVERARRSYPWFPPGEIVEDEQPDLMLVDGNDRIGIEVTELFQPPKHGAKFGPHVVAKFHRRVMEIAERCGQSLSVRDVLVYFDHRHLLDDAKKCANVRATRIASVDLNATLARTAVIGFAAQEAQAAAVASVAVLASMLLSPFN